MHTYTYTCVCMHTDIWTGHLTVHHLLPTQPVVLGRCSYYLSHSISPPACSIPWPTKLPRAGESLDIS
jgi:hypothetical protein